MALAFSSQQLWAEGSFSHGHIAVICWVTSKSEVHFLFQSPLQLCEEVDVITHYATGKKMAIHTEVKKFSNFMELGGNRAGTWTQTLSTESNLSSVLLFSWGITFQIVNTLLFSYYKRNISLLNSIWKHRKFYLHNARSCFVMQSISLRYCKDIFN